ncbi:hypothetical protein [Pseudoalteromonas rubra]|uniref:hypothetical protein n=1 Tax=Pseudoalteromonas rubra TaxID=43658 RepID=UPI002DBF4B0F|nr:hypothetical protein [Pseudoalteromonas rubra]MEC4090916.1 hypothetical protein [Pseudoalteromonas rubra]
MDFYLFGVHFTGDLLFYFGLIFACGFVFGWFCRKGNIFWCLVGLLIFYPVMQFAMVVDTWFITIPFVAGFLVHTGKPLFRRLFQQ